MQMNISGVPGTRRSRLTRADQERVRLAREAIGPHVELFVDANGAYGPKEALAQAIGFAEQRVSWFEEPVSSDDLEGLRLVRHRGPAGMDIAAGEYGYDAFYFRRMLEAEAVDVLQADASRCGGITGFLQADALCHARGIALSAHCAPSLHVHVGCAAQAFVHLEYFHDHARIERTYFDGAIAPKKGSLEPDLGRPGLGLALKKRDIAPFALGVA
jgi:L-alanine-DL-glutamate epimerase-like enolase superfamily enzyme